MGNARPRPSPPADGRRVLRPSGHCGGGPDSEAWSNSGFRTSISPVCERTRVSGAPPRAGEGPGLVPSPASSPARPALTGARPGHSYTVKSPSSFSSSEEAESSSLGGSLCLSEGQERRVLPHAPGARVRGYRPGWGQQAPRRVGRAGGGRASYRSRHRICCLWCW